MLGYCLAQGGQALGALQHMHVLSMGGLPPAKNMPHALYEHAWRLQARMQHTFKLLMTLSPLLTSCGSIWLMP